MEDVKRITYNNGSIVFEEDNRTLISQKEIRISMEKECANIAILEAYPTYKQNNAALGLLTPEETQGIKNGIQAIRTECTNREAAISACSSLNELDALTFANYAG